MKRSRFTEEQVIGILREQEAGAKTVDVCRKHGVSQTTFFKWKSKYGRMIVLTRTRRGASSRATFVRTSELLLS